MSLLDFDIEAKTIDLEFTSRQTKPASRLISESNFPIAPKKSTWSKLENPDRLLKEFKFNDFRQQLDFVNEFMIYQEKMSHHTTLVIDHNLVTIETYTKDVNTVTELDLSLAEFADLLYQDVMYYYAVDNVDNEKYL